MNRVNPQIRNFAERLVVYDTGENESPGKKAPAVFDDCEKLRLRLTTLMGAGGFRALLSRALALAAAEVPWLRAVQVKADGSLEGLEEIYSQLTPKIFLEGRVVLLAQLLGLLVAFIGENLTLRLVHEVWPEVPLDNFDFGEGGKK